MILALAAAIATVAAAAATPTPVSEAPRARRVASVSAGIEEALAGLSHGVVAFGELHQTNATAGIPSALHRFTEDVLPGLSGRLAYLVVETWMTTGKCGEAERAVTADVERTTQRPAHTETEIETLIRVADERGVVPRILSIACTDYQAMLGAGGGGVDYDRTLKVTARALEPAILRALASARAPAAATAWSPSTAGRCTTMPTRTRNWRPTASRAERKPRRWGSTSRSIWWCRNTPPAAPPSAHRAGGVPICVNVDRARRCWCSARRARSWWFSRRLRGKRNAEARGWFCEDQRS